MTTFDALTALFVPNDEPFGTLEDRWCSLGHRYESGVWPDNEDFRVLSVAKPGSRTDVFFQLLFSRHYTDFMPLEPVEEPLSAPCFGLYLGRRRSGDFAWMFTKLSETPLTPVVAYEHLREYVRTGDEEQGSNSFLYRNKKFVLESYKDFLSCLNR
jgi:hypothetical protein